MQSSEEQPVVDNASKHAEEAEENKQYKEPEDPQAFQPLYEFPPEGSQFNLASQPAPITQVLPEGEPVILSAAKDLSAGLEYLPLDEAVRQGLVYPPPPSYYQNMPVLPVGASAEQPHSGNGEGSGRVSIPSRPSPIYRPASYVPQRQMPPGNVQLYPPQPPGAFPAYMPPPPAKKSHTWVWLLVTILSVIVLASCGLCGWAFYTIFNTTYQQVSGSLDVVNDYYTNLQSSNYTAAYHDLAITGLTQEAFSTQATKIDTQDGPVLSFTLGQPSFQTNSNTGPSSLLPPFSHFNVTVDVKRAHSSYSALLTVSKIGGSWKITYYDRL
jgi:hypothetical protein